MVLSNILSINRITRHKYAGSKGLNTALQIWSQTLLGAGKASIVAPVKVYRELSAQGNLLVRLVSMVEVYIMRPIVSLAVLAAYALLSALFILPLSFFKLQTSRFSSEETNENGVRMLPVTCVAGFGYNKDFSFASPCFSLGMYPYPGGTRTILLASIPPALNPDTTTSNCCSAARETTNNLRFACKFAISKEATRPLLFVGRHALLLSFARRRFCGGRRLAPHLHKPSTSGMN